MKAFIFTALFISILSMGVQLSSPFAYAAGKVNCDQVMSEINSGKTIAEVAKDPGRLQKKRDALSQTLPRRGIQDGWRHGFPWCDGKSRGTYESYSLVWVSK